MRKSLEETWSYLSAEGEEMPRHPDGRPLVPDGMPNYDDEVLGFSFFRCGVEDADYGGLTLPRTFFGRSELVRVRFVNTDLSESRMCWNDFVECDFSQADLTGCDMRASLFTTCRFAGACLRGADLRWSTFEECDFTGADLTGATAEDRINGVRRLLSPEQQAVMVWTADSGPEPPGG